MHRTLRRCCGRPKIGGIARYAESLLPCALARLGGGDGDGDDGNGVGGGDKGGGLTRRSPGEPDRSTVSLLPPFGERQEASRRPDGNDEPASET